MTFAVALSGGGFRATLASLGVLRFLSDCGRLGNVRYVSSVSGGSLAHGLFARHYEALRKDDFAPDAFDSLVLNPFISRISGESLIWKLVRNAWQIVGRKTRTQLLADVFAEWFVGDRPLASLAPEVRFVFNAANLSTGVRFTLERDVIGDYVIGYVPTGATDLRLADAVAASAAFPGGFCPLVLRGLRFPCEDVAVDEGRTVTRTPKLIDGGAYDNMGLEVVRRLTNDELIIGLNAGGVFRTGSRIGKVPLVRDLSRVNSLLYRQSTATRRREMVDRFKAWEDHRRAPKEARAPEWAQRGVLFGLTTTFDKRPPNARWLEGRERGQNPALIEPLAKVKTTFARFSPETCVGLVYRGWWLAGATLTTFHEDVLPDDLPRWRPLAAEA